MERTFVSFTVSWHLLCLATVSFLHPLQFKSQVCKRYRSISYIFYYSSIIPKTLKNSNDIMITIIFREDAEWQVAVLSFLFLVIGMGNIITTTWTMTAKIRDRQKGYFKFRFTRLDKYFWTHKRRGPESCIVKVKLLLL